MKDKNIDVFLEKMANGEIVYKDGVLYGLYRNDTKLKVPRKLGRTTNRGYIQLSATVNGDNVTTTAHRLIWAFFNGRDNLDQNLEINHINGIKTDNRIENLELVTPSENLKHAYRNNLKPYMYGEDNPDSRLTKKDVVRIKELFDFGLTNLEISKIYDVTSTTINWIRKGKTWSHVTGINQKRVDVNG